jgi:predicted aconitase
MFLTDDQQAMLDGKRGEIVQRCMRLLVRLGEIYGAGEMMPIRSAQVAGVSYKNLGDPGLDFLKDFADKGAEVVVPTFLNPAGMDLVDWKELGFPERFAEKQNQVIGAFRKMGITISATCTPYLAGNRPNRGEHLAWSESSAVSFANSVIGARTNREGGPSSLAAAICGFTPKYGLHLDENRRPELVIHVSARLDSEADFGALGNWAGRKAGKRIPYFTGIKAATEDQLKILGASMAASGAVAMYHVRGITPEARQDISGLETIDFGEKEKRETYKALNTTDHPDLIVFGCPHASIDEIRDIAERLKGKHIKRQLWVCTSRVVKEKAEKEGLVKAIREAGGHVVADTCMVVAPIEEMGIASTGVNSGKAAAYLPGHCKQKVMFRSIDKLIEEALK